MFASEPLEDLTENFCLAVESADAPPEMAAFYRHESDGSLHCSVNVYFSPAAVEFAESIGAKPCSRPSVYGLCPIADSEQAIALLFPEEKPS